MRILLNIIAALLICTGGVFFFQGIGVLPGSFMSGDVKWALYGGIILVVGILVLMASNRKKVR
jgi:hypothetical protein